MTYRTGSLSTIAARMRGITFIELMIVIVIIGILAAFAYPSYQDQVRKTRRADGQTALMDKAQQLERCYTRFSAYNDGNCGVVLPELSPDGYYQIVASGTITAATYTLDATPQAEQVADGHCGTLRVKSTGEQGSQGADTDVNGCWP